MASINLELLKRLCESPGIPGREAAVRRVVLDEMKPIADDVSIDPLGNVVGLKKGTGGLNVMIAAHMDEIGFLVSHVDDKGFVRFHPVGGFDPRVLPAQRVLVHTQRGETLRGVLQFSGKPIHLLSPSEIKAPAMEDFFIDLGLSVDRVKELVEIGDMITMDRTLEVVGDTVVSKSLDDRVGIFVMLEAMRAAGRIGANVYGVATTQEEVGLRGARTAAYTIEPDVSIALDTTLAIDIPEGKERQAVTRLGGGAAIKIMDSSVISNPALVRHFRDLAEANDIPYQLEILPRGGTDAGATQLARGGNPAITLSIPSRYVHIVNEMASPDDIDACIRLLTAFLRDAGTRSYIETV